MSRSLLSMMGALLLALAFAPRASAYELKRTPSGDLVRWARGPVELHVAPVPTQASFDRETLDEALTHATDAWRGIGGAPDVLATRAPSDDAVGSIHVLTSWPTERWGHRLAVTITTYDMRGRLLEADVFINGSLPLAVLDEQAPAGAPPAESWDLSSVLTHELGHVLGLDESDVADAVMAPELPRGRTSQRVLREDDEAGILALYGDSPNEHLRYGCDASRGPGGAPPALALVFALALLVSRRLQRR
ncbi:MAG TPA: matrixin family metalloprotease [Polyangiaceae bacterium LLY-WYZ-15_(1-7)]|nr:hypothetical protein [Myxococcales bacterium]HJL00618.1 matrixin family metalloprotease [Polyangiaceae bacterium LLY-WYZ-15_(1-7)]HJL13182.1 matrixin family metalloprotease [Polyangiaceae bacterium LLY-WYZ-15_(1-7)]HJL32355.1 matrixin family metalloprotease [Polyangiaceae bacterium LLY-WYZ-15_(1-7)]HJL39572.1 matrixin family metalloprotease [Polyangiaceae bacterium LLY-WYZ-15_(1-7)]